MASKDIKIGYIGLGSLGSAIFPNLIKYAQEQGLAPPSAWNRSQDKYAALNQEYPDIHTAKELGELVRRSNVIFTCLVNDAAAEDVYTKIVEILRSTPGGVQRGSIVFADQSTLKAKTACT